MYGKPRRNFRKMSATKRAYLAGVSAGKRSASRRKRSTFKKKRWY